MAGKVKPFNVPPLIKCARYSLLILGYFYGSFRLSALRIYERRAREIRLKMLHEKEERRRQSSRESSIQEVLKLAKEIGGPIEFEPGWEKNL